MALSEESYHRLLRRLQGSGYTVDEDSARDNELRAVARIAAKAGEALEAASRNLFAATVDEALDQLERVRFFVGSTALSLSERRARLVAFARGAHDAVRARLDAAFLGEGATLLATRSDLEQHRASPLGALVVGRRQPASTASTEEQVQRDLDPVLERGLPSRAISGGVTRRDLVYGMALDASAASVQLTPPVTVLAQTKARAAPLEVHPGARLSRGLWLELQAMLLWKSHGVSLDQAKQGRTVALKLSLAAGASATDTSIAWQGRIVSAWGASTASAADDLTALSQAELVWLGAARLGAAGDPTTFPLVGLDGSDSGLRVKVDPTGGLVVTNGSAGARNVTLLVRATPPLAAGDDTQPWRDRDKVVRAELEELYRAQVVSSLGTPGLLGGAPAGAVRRVVYTGGLSRPGAEASSLTSALYRVVLDTSEDYRDRLVLVVPLSTGAAGRIPCASADGLSARSDLVDAPRLFYTGAAGATGSTAAATPYQCPDSLTRPNVWLYADASGQLVAEMKATSYDEAATVAALLIATEKLSGTSVVTPVPLHATSVQTLDLEQPQNVGAYAQGFQGGAPRYLLTDPPPKSAPIAPPLGLIAEGHAPLRPVSFRARERLGARADGALEVRQKLVGQRRRVVALTLAPDSLTPVDTFNLPTELAPGVNDQMDFRDRLVWVEGRYGTGTPSTPFVALLYTGPTSNVEVPIGPELSVYFELSRQAGGYHSRLFFRNTGAALEVHATIEASGFLGLSDLRQYGVVNAFMYASGDALEVDETRGYSDDFHVTGGPYIDL
jgi:hypothetical protein